MIERVQGTDLMQVQTYGLAEFLTEVEGLINSGFTFDMEDNQHYPQVIGHLYVVTMHPKDKKKEVQKVATEATTADSVEVPEEFKELQRVVEEGKKQGRKARTAN